jgi:hypothetical protein
VQWLEKIIWKWLRKPYNPFPPRENQREKLQRQQSEAQAARLVLESPAYNRAYQVLLARYGDALLETRPHDAETRERIYLQAYLLQEMVRELAAMVQADDVESARAESSSESLRNV